MRPIAVCLLVLFCTQWALADAPKHRKLRGVPFTDVQLNDAFWAPRLKTCREQSIPHNFEWCENTGRFSNFAKAAGRAEGKFEGIYFNDSDVYKVLEGASYSLADHPDPGLDKMVDDVISKIAAAQQENGYLNSYYTLVEPDKKWTDCAVRHELYCAGHLFEAAVAHYRATGKKSLLDVAEKFAAHIGDVFGPGKRTDVPGHEEIELALVKLYELTGKPEYLEMAAFFLDARGNEANRPRLYGPYCQDHKPVREQDEVVGHAVRAMYLYSGVADVAAHTGDEGFMRAMDRIWDDVVHHKMYVTGGIGARHEGEAFGDRFELPNQSAYAETCAAIGLALWAQRMNLLHADAAYADVVERVLYNGFLSGVGLTGKEFFYVNPLESAGGHHRQPFYPCACCPTNVIRVLPSVPGYLYAVEGNRLFVNLYAQSEADVKLGDASVSLKQETRYPWDGAVKITVSPAQAKEFALNLRIPDWCRAATLSVDGRSVPAVSNDRGYVEIARTWKPGDVVALDLPMEIERIEANPLVEANRGRVAVRRGPVIYCFEGVDNDVNVLTMILARDPQFTAEYREDMLGGVVVIQGKDRKGRNVTAVPYYAWDNREAGPMAVWVRQDGKTRAPATDDPSWEGKLYRTMDPGTLGPSEPPTLMESAVPSASFRSGNNTLTALNDGIQPKDSCDHDIPRFTWWDHRGTKEWVQYDFEEPVRASQVDVYWFDDERIGRHCRAPESWRLLYRDGDDWKPVENPSEYGTKLDAYNTTTFKPVTTGALRIEVQLKQRPEPWSGGILEWKVKTIEWDDCPHRPGTVFASVRVHSWFAPTLRNRKKMASLAERIQELKKDRRAVILAHNYQLPEIQDIADIRGDSLQLSREAAKTEADVIVFCGVHFMAETAAMLSPQKTVLLPAKDAGCPMADMITAEQLRELKGRHPGAIVVCYVNSSAEVKAESDYCCTSANAVSVVGSLPAGREIIFVPDQYLGQFAAERTGRDLILWNGYCPTHVRITEEAVSAARAEHPGAKVIVHPECTQPVRQAADEVLSTGGMCRFAAESQATEFIVGTEIGMVHRLAADNPGKQFHPVAKIATCPNMKKITLEKLLWSLDEMVHVITVPPQIRQRALGAIERMVSISG